MTDKDSKEALVALQQAYRYIGWAKKELVRSHKLIRKTMIKKEKPE